MLPWCWQKGDVGIRIPHKYLIFLVRNPIACHVQAVFFRTKIDLRKPATYRFQGQLENICFCKRRYLTERNRPARIFHTTSLIEDVRKTRSPVNRNCGNTNFPLSVRELKRSLEINNLLVSAHVAKSTSILLWVQFVQVLLHEFLRVPCKLSVTAVPFQMSTALRVATCFHCSVVGLRAVMTLMLGMVGWALLEGTGNVRILKKKQWDTRQASRSESSCRGDVINNVLCCWARTAEERGVLPIFKKQQ